MISVSAAPTTTRPEDVGGKAASLFRLLELGCDVPEFFVLTAQAYRAHGGGRLSPSAREEVLAAWRALGAESHAFAVRSSGLAEDSAEHSFAGVFDTVLDVRGADALIEAIERCWASHRSEAADAYRAVRGIDLDEAMAVVVQRMVEADWAGVSFTADPLTQALSLTVVNAVRGGADKLVSGLVNPEEIKVRTATGEIVERRGPPGEPPLPDWILRQVVKESNRVAQAYGFPQDLEWASEGGRVRLLQSRPITTVAGVFHNRALEPWAPGGDPDAPERVWSRAYADEIWTPPVSPLFYDVQNLTPHVAWHLGLNGDNRPVPPDVFKYFRAAVYMDVDALERMYVSQPPISRRPTLLGLLPTNRQEGLRRAPWDWFSVLRKVWTFEVKNGANWSLRNNHKVLERAWDGFLDATAPLMDRDLASLDEADLEAHLAEVWAVAGIVGIECQVAVLYHAHDLKLLLTGLLDRWCGNGDELYGAVSAGLEASHTVRETDTIWSIAEAIRAAGPEALQTARITGWTEFARLGRGLRAGAALDAAEAFLAGQRHRGANYKDLIHPRWGDDPEMLWSVIQSFLDAEGPRPTEVNARSAASRVEAQRKVLASLRGPLAPFRRWVLRRLFRYNEIYAGLRDNHRFYYDQVWWMVRRVYLEIGRRMQRDGLLAAVDDVFFLVRPEIAQLRAGELSPSLAAERIAIRRAEWLRTRREQPPKFLRQGYAPDADWAADETAAGLTGLGASPGQAVGRARVVYDIAELSRVERGDILVTRQTDPGWTPAFARLGGLVLETGGVLAHGASLCREFGLPCVTAVERATLLIGDGDLIAVDGSAGVIEIVEAAAASA